MPKGTEHLAEYLVFKSIVHNRTMLVTACPQQDEAATNAMRHDVLFAKSLNHNVRAIDATAYVNHVRLRGTVQKSIHQHSPMPHRHQFHHNPKSNRISAILKGLRC
jgi:hypothetical protein